MKKQKCECKNNYNSTCGHCTTSQERWTTDSNLYAAEYLLYAFHFEDKIRPREEHSVHAFRMMAIEG